MQTRNRVGAFDPSAWERSLDGASTHSHHTWNGTQKRVSVTQPSLVPSQELERVAPAGASAATAAQKKRERALEMQLTYMCRDFFYYRMKQWAIMTVSLATMFYVLRTWFLGKSVAELPFVPMFPFTRLCHQWLEKPGPTDCSFMFLYVICNVGIKPNVAKLMGTQLPASVQKATDMQSMTARFARLTTGKGM